MRSWHVTIDPARGGCSAEPREHHPRQGGCPRPCGTAARKAAAVLRTAGTCGGKTPSFDEAWFALVWFFPSLLPPLENFRTSENKQVRTLFCACVLCLFVNLPCAAAGLTRLRASSQNMSSLSRSFSQALRKRCFCRVTRAGLWFFR